MAIYTTSIDILMGGMFLLLPFVVISLIVKYHYNNKTK